MPDISIVRFVHCSGFSLKFQLYAETKDGREKARAAPKETMVRMVVEVAGRAPQLASLGHRSPVRLLQSDHTVTQI